MGKMTRVKELCEIIVVILITIGLCACSNSLYDLAVKREAPFPGVVIAESINEGMAVSLSWEKDEGADTYILMRSEEGQTGYGEFEQVYAGKEIRYIDRSMRKEVSYMYRLDKVRGNKLFSGEKVTLFGRKLEEPKAGVIMIRSFNEGHTAYLTWEGDEWTDIYIVMRTEVTSEGINFEDADVTESYEIAEITSYTDNKIDIEKSYVYRLDKKRGEKRIEGKEYAFFTKTRMEPFFGSISAKSLSGGKASYLTWEADSGADEYRIMRSLNDESSVEFVPREDGEDGFYMQGPTAALDSNLADDKSYLYRLDKKRGEEWHIGREITVFSRTRPMPYGEAPYADGFRWDGNIYLQWSEDEGADTYILQRRFDNISGFDSWITVKELTDTQYLDQTVNAAQSGRYEYRLDKRRNGEIHKWDNETTLAVAAQTEEDKHEPNNRREESTLIEVYREANVYHYGYNDTRTLTDMDWYKVSIPAGKIANIAVIYDNESHDEYFRLYQTGHATESIVHNNAFQIKNDSLIQQYVSFAIQPDPIKFLTNGSGGSTVSYTIRWVSITDN